MRPCSLRSASLLVYTGKVRRISRHSPHIYIYIYFFFFFFSFCLFPFRIKSNKTRRKTAIVPLCIVFFVVYIHKQPFWLLLGILDLCVLLWTTSVMLSWNSQSKQTHDFGSTLELQHKTFCHKLCFDKYEELSFWGAHFGPFLLVVKKHNIQRYFSLLSAHTHKNTYIGIWMVIRWSNSMVIWSRFVQLKKWSPWTRK